MKPYDTCRHASRLLLSLTLVAVIALLLGCGAAVASSPLDKSPATASEPPAADAQSGSPSTTESIAIPATGSADVVESNPTPLPPISPEERLPVDTQLSRDIRVDQVGFQPGMKKAALVLAPSDGAHDRFAVINDQTGEQVLIGKLSAPAVDQDSLDNLQVADFTPLREPGTYRIAVPGVGASYPFRIAEDVYHGLFQAALDSYSLTAQNAPQAWHTDPATSKDDGEQLDLTGGWPDAGDYGKYVPTGAATAGQLLLLWEMFPAQAGQAGEQVSGGEAPHFLQVVREELDWLLKMQRKDGAVYTKVTPENFPGFDKNVANLPPIYVYSIDTPSTASFAAAMAQAARIYRPYDASFAARAQAAAKQAWKFLQTSEPVYSSGEGTGNYTFTDDAPARFWAAVELFKTTGDKAYHDYALSYLRDTWAGEVTPIAWDNMQTVGLVDYYQSPHADQKIRQSIRDALQQWADEAVTMVHSPINIYQVALAKFQWASNKETLAVGQGLMIVSKLTGNKEYADAAFEQLHYVLGRNAMAKSYVTGFGGDPVRNPHNRIIYSTGQMIPGLLVGGPNDEAQDGIAPPALGPKSYVDDTGAYAVNENAIDYNAPLVFLTAGTLSAAP